MDFGFHGDSYDVVFHTVYQIKDNGVFASSFLQTQMVDWY